MPEGGHKAKDVIKSPAMKFEIINCCKSCMNVYES